MLKNLFKYSIRALLRQKSYLIINTLGLSVGLACSLIIAIFIFHELSYDQFHDKKDRLYRVILNGKLGGQEVEVTSTASVIGPTMLNEFPEVESFLRINPWGETVIKKDERTFMESRLLEVDSTFFGFFSIPLIHGNPKTVLNREHCAVLSESLAKKIYGDEYPVDQMIRIGTDSTYYLITGVMADMPDNTHLRGNILTSFMTNPRSRNQHWLSNSFDTYVLLHEGASTDAIDQRFTDMIIKYVGPVINQYFGVTMDDFLTQGNKYRMYLQPLTDIHLNPRIENMLKQPNDPKYLWIFGSIGLLIILIAAVNFMNLSTAQSTKRAKEVGIKKVSGSSRGMLISQFLIESILLSVVAMLLAVLLVEFCLPYFNELLNIHLHFNPFENIWIIPALLAFCIFTGILAGSYPAFYISSYNPYQVLKGILRSGRHNSSLRSSLVVLQFTISIVLIVGTGIMFRQISFMLNKDLGFDKEQVLVLSNINALRDHQQSFKKDVKNISGVMNAAISTAVPGRNNNNNGYRLKGREKESFLLQTNWVDCDFLETYGIELADGRFFSDESEADNAACILNAQAVKHYNMTDPFSEKFIVSENDAEEITFMPVIGVVDNFHFESLQKAIGPYMMRFRDENFHWGFVSIRLKSGVSKETIQEIEDVWKDYTGNEPMQYFFMDQHFERLYREEKTNAELSIIFTILGILIAALGLYGLTSFTVQQRTKEIGVRKTFGASIFTIWMLINREILKLVGIATLIAWPLIYWAASNWLNHYHYRIDLNPIDFLIGFAIAALIALLTTSYRVVRAARINPSESLRYE